MKKLLIGTALLFAALPFTFDGVTPTVSKAHAIIGRPLTPMSVAGVHRRAMRRTYGVGANLGYHSVARTALYGAAAYGAGYYGLGYGGGYDYHPCALTLSCTPWTPGVYLDPIARAALLQGPYGYGYPTYGYGYGTGYYGGYRYGYHPVARHIYATAVGVRRHWRY